MIQSYKDLNVYKRSYSLALKIYEIAKTLPKEEQYGLSSQLRRAATSIPLNIAEGYGRKSSEAEFKHFLRTSLGSCNEVRVLVDMLKDLSLISNVLYQELSDEYHILARQLYNLIKKWQKYPTSGI